MPENMKESLKSVVLKSWNEPRRFFIWLTLFSLIGIAIGYAIFASTNALQILPGWLGNFLLTATAVCLAGLLLGFGCFVLAWIPPVCRLLTWLLQRRFFVLACLVTLVALFYAEENWRGKRAWDNCRHEWEAKCEKFDFKDFIPPPVLDEQNFALTPIVASCYNHILDRSGHRIKPANTNIEDRLTLDIYRQVDRWSDHTPTNGNWMKGTITDLRGWQDYYRRPSGTNTSGMATNEFPVATQPQTPAADVLLALSKYDAAIEELRQVSRLPASRFPVNYDDENPAAILLPHLAALKRCSQVLQLRSQAELQNGRPETALADVKLSLYLINSIHTEPFLISHLVRIAMLQIALQPIYEGWAGHLWSDEQLVALDAELAKLDFLADYKFTMRGELGIMDGIFDFIRKNPEQLVRLFVMMNDGNPADESVPLVPRIICHAIPNGWLYQNQLNYARSMVNYNIPLADSTNRIFSVNLCRQGEVNLNATRTPWAIFNYMKSMLLPALGAGAKKFAVAQASVDLARTALALERYRLAHGEFPESLDALAPQFIAAVPHDVISGQPLKYRRTSDGQFVLYSVGWNETDDGGVVGLRESGSVDISKGDWVWRYPQK